MVSVVVQLRGSESIKFVVRCHFFSFEMAPKKRPAASVVNNDGELIVQAPNQSLEEDIKQLQAEQQALKKERKEKARAIRNATRKKKKNCRQMSSALRRGSRASSPAPLTEECNGAS